MLGINSANVFDVAGASLLISAGRAVRSIQI